MPGTHVVGLIAAVASWPGEGVTLLIIFVVLLAITAAVVNARGMRAETSDGALDEIAPPTASAEQTAGALLASGAVDDSVAGERAPRDI